MPLSSLLPVSKLHKMPDYAFGQIDALKLKLINEGKEIIDLSLGSPDGPTHPKVLETLKTSMDKLRNQQYPIFSGHPALKQAVKEWMKNRFNVEVNADQGVLPLIGSKEGIGHLAFAYIQPGDLTIVPSPYYPVHMRGSNLAGGDIYELELKRENNFVGDLDSIPVDILRRAKIMILSYPQNPTGAVVDRAYMEKAVKLCREYEIILLNDLAYSEIWYDDNKPISILEIEGAMDVAIEFQTFSKTYNMSGMRLGFAVGNEKIVQTLYKLKTNLDYGVCMGVQEAGVTALGLGDEYREDIRKEYQARRDLVVKELREMGFDVYNPGGAMYIWVPIPEKYQTCFEFVQDLLEKANVAAVPGTTFGQFGERFIRLALVQNQEKLKQAMNNIKAAGLTP